ncbi:hypothetical protein [Gordonia shandongensis]|uniref:hypothetical protein n=1 Tax=Gordonia shandongensis TaxID=376351 RepID=UPI000410DA34|nr:hypothetical protein [Gordonia shandongensis]
MKIRNFAVGVVLAGVVVSTAACGTDDDNADATPVPSSTSVSSSAVSGVDAELTDGKKVPKVKALNEMLQKALDPKVKSTEKVDLVEGAEADPSLFDQLVKAKKENPKVKYEIKNPVLKNGPKKAKFKVEVALPNNPPTTIDASIVFDDGRWKLSKQTVCPLLTQAEVDSPLCGSAKKNKKSAAKSSSAERGASKSSSAPSSKRAS